MGHQRLWIHTWKETDPLQHPRDVHSQDRPHPSKHPSNPLTPNYRLLLSLDKPHTHAPAAARGSKSTLHILGDSKLSPSTRFSVHSWVYLQAHRFIHSPESPQLCVCASVYLGPRLDRHVFRELWRTRKHACLSYTQTLFHSSGLPGSRGPERRTHETFYLENS